VIAHLDLSFSLRQSVAKSKSPKAQRPWGFYQNNYTNYRLEHEPTLRQREATGPHEERFRHCSKPELREVDV